MQEISKNIEFARQALEELLPELPSPLTYGLNYDEIDFFGSDIQKPPKEEFEAKLQELIDAQPLKELRTKRNTLLAKTDKYALPDWPHETLAKQTEWIEYRQALRDLPGNTEDPANPVWPVRPDEVVEEETSNVTTEEETSNVTTEEETSNVTTEEETSNVTTEEETSNVTTEEETSNVTTEEETSSHT